MICDHFGLDKGQQQKMMPLWKGEGGAGFLTSCFCCLVTKAVFCFVAITVPWERIDCCLLLELDANCSPGMVWEGHSFRVLMFPEIILVFDRAGRTMNTSKKLQKVMCQHFWKEVWIFFLTELFTLVFCIIPSRKLSLKWNALSGHLYQFVLEYPVF